MQRTAELTKAESNHVFEWQKGICCKSLRMSAGCSLHSWATVDASWFSPWHLTSSNEIWNVGQRNVSIGNTWHMYISGCVSGGSFTELPTGTGLGEWMDPRWQEKTTPILSYKRELGGLGTQKIERPYKEGPASSGDSEKMDKTTNNSEHLHHQNGKLWCFSCPPHSVPNPIWNVWKM